MKMMVFRLFLFAMISCQFGTGETIGVKRPFFFPLRCLVWFGSFSLLGSFPGFSKVLLTLHFMTESLALLDGLPFSRRRIQAKRV